MSSTVNTSESASQAANELMEVLMQTANRILVALSFAPAADSALLKQYKRELYKDLVS